MKEKTSARKNGPILMLLILVLLAAPAPIGKGKSFAQSSGMTTLITFAAMFYEIYGTIDDAEQIYTASMNASAGQLANFGTQWSRLADNMNKARRKISDIALPQVGFNVLAAAFLEGCVSNCDLGEEALVAYKKILIDDQNKLYAISRDLNAVLARTTKFESKISGLADIFFDLALYSTVAAKSETNNLILQWSDIEIQVREATFRLNQELSTKLSQVNRLIELASTEQSNINAIYNKFLSRCPLSASLQKQSIQQIRDLVSAKKTVRIAIMDSSGTFIGSKAFWNDYVFSHSETLRRDLGIRQIFVLEGTMAKDGEFTIKTQSESTYISCWRREKFSQLKSGLKIADTWEKFHFEPFTESDPYLIRIIDFTGNHLYLNRKEYNSIQCKSSSSGAETGFLIYKLN
jgi:hypothetical protein